jgi:hypothetical protein
MILRRFTAGLRRQDWTAVLVELFVVVAGVFIGLQASNWNEAREQDEKGARFAESLKADLRAEAWGYEYDVRYWGNVLANANRIEQALSGKADLADADFLIIAFRATQYNENTRHRATYDELRSTGSLGLIRDAALRETAMRLYTTNNLDNIVQEGRASPYRRLFRMTVPNAIQRELEAKCGDRPGIVGDYKTNFDDAINYPCAIDADRDAIAASVASLRSHSDFLPLLRLQVVGLESSVANLTIYEGDIHASLRDFAQP